MKSRIFHNEKAALRGGLFGAVTNCDPARGRGAAFATGRSGRSLAANPFFVLAALLFLAWLFLPLLVRTSADEELMGYAESKGPWSVDGVRLGWTAAECEKLLGKPARTISNNYGKKVVAWSGTAEVTVTFDEKRAGGAVEILGRTLTEYSGKGVVFASMNENEVRAVLPHASSKGSYRPGSFVISCVPSKVGTTYACRDQSGVYEISFYEGAMRYVRAAAE